MSKKLKTAIVLSLLWACVGLNFETKELMFFCILPLGVSWGTWWIFKK